jgi:hypothetical protein
LPLNNILFRTMRLINFWGTLKITTYHLLCLNSEKKNTEIVNLRLQFAFFSY